MRYFSKFNRGGDDTAINKIVLANAAVTKTKKEMFLGFIKVPEPTGK